MATRTPANVAAKWATRMGQSVTAYKAGIARVTVSPGALAARAATTWIANTTAAKTKFIRQASAVSLATWQNKAETKGANRLATGATAAKTKFQAVMTSLLPFITTVVRGLPARGGLTANINRATAFMRGMAAYQKPAGT